MVFNVQHTPRPAGLRVAKGSRGGVKTSENQDAVLIRPAPRSRPGAGMLCAVADGVGGLAHGAAASHAAVHTAAAAYLAAFDGDVAKALRRSVEAAHHAVSRATASGTAGQSGATTLVIAVVREAELWVANVGDSRAYLVSPERGIIQVTEDHSWVQEQVRAGTLRPQQAAVHPWRRVITRCLGGEAVPEADVFFQQLAPGCRILLCSDGLTEVVEEEDLAGALAGDDPEAAVNLLLELADQRGARDDVTLCVVQLGAWPPKAVQATADPLAATATRRTDASPDLRAVNESSRHWRSIFLLALVAVALAVAGAAWWRPTG